jgi:DNA-binding transcriptional regulator YiaG
MRMRKSRLLRSSAPIPRVSNCGTIVIDEEASEKISDKLREEAGLLKPEQIRAGRARLELSQQDFARLLGVAVATLSRWETGAQIQQRVLNDYMQAFFALPELREYLAKLHGVATAEYSPLQS